MTVNKENLTKRERESILLLVWEQEYETNDLESRVTYLTRVMF